MGRKNLPKRRVFYCKAKGLFCKKTGKACAMDANGQCSEEFKLLRIDVELTYK